ncbi:SART-1 protein [Punctularia strigosozonata HHB-11173 SS5]|uniref:SART-1 protein n=1 Tax=Punctularia strigosozonata (strain HHB-11173) TaxID=741275 RepID=R7S3A2_PUNST|nr:SART-1 protein [Punctularia strigosozonata HHB-11173 SS5]EIN04885.1 SART-1 protein [Punctularia strigosozonata HHB-11173 SS5]
MSMEESISLEETNKIRISLGLKPLTDDNAPANDPDKIAAENYEKKRAEDAKAREAKRIKDRIAKLKNQHELNAKLTGVTLGEAADDVDDTVKWLKRAKKREKELAKKRQQELENMDKMYQEEYTEKDLEGLKVSHDFDDMEEGQEQILTLKDSRVLDDEEDVLQNVELAEEERHKKNQELKTKRRDYTGYDDDEFTGGREGMKRAVLAKYDDDLEGPKETGFRLGGAAASSKISRADKVEEAAKVNKALLSIDYTKNFNMNDYLQEGDAGFKKPKTKKKRPSRRQAEVDPEVNLNGDSMETDEQKPIAPRQRDLNANFVDDDELQAALARSRRAKQAKPKKIKPEDIAQKIVAERLRAHADDTMVVDGAVKIEDDDGVGADGEGGLVFDETSEFVSSISYDPVVAKQEVKNEPTEASLRASSKQSTPAPVKRGTSPPIASDGDVPMEELEAGEVVVKEEEDDAAMLDAIEEAINATEAEERKKATAGDDVVGTSSEQTFNSGMASTLNILRQQGLIATPSADQMEREKVQRQRDLWLAEQRKRVALRDLEKAKARGQNKDQATREYENRLREQQEARENLEMYKNYKPDINIVYHDEFGRELTPKEAWKALSHKFHGKGSGKMKTEKRLKKIAEEKKKEAMISGDTPLSMNRAFQMRQEKTGQAHFVLSVGNRGAVPQAEEFLDPQPLTKSTKGDKKGKKKEHGHTGTPQPVDSTGFLNLPQPFASTATTPDPSARPSPAPKPGFSRISNATTPAEGSSTASGTTHVGERNRLAISFGKRKADEDASGTPPPKRR